MRDIEHQIAITLMAWWAYYSHGHGLDERLLFAIPNGGARHIGTARRLKAEGVRAGVSDYFLAIPVGGKTGLFLELKAGGPGIERGKVSPQQQCFGETVKARGYAFRIAYGTEEAIRAIETYLTPDLTTSKL